MNGYEFGGPGPIPATYDKKKSSDTIGVKTLIVKIKGEAYTLKVYPVERMGSQIQIPIEIINSNIHRNFAVRASEDGKDDTAENLMVVFKQQTIEALKEFIKEKKRIEVMSQFNDMLDSLKINEDDVAVEEL